MAFIATDWTITRANGNIRYTGDDHNGAAPSYATVIELHRALQDFADDATSSGDDELDITDGSPTDRSTDNIITLLGSYNIDDSASEHLFDGSIIQNSGAVIYDGIINFGNAETIQIVQNGAVVVDDWWNFDSESTGLGLNSNIASGISHRFMVLVRTGGTDIDGRRLLGTSRTFGQTYSEFSINGSSRGNNVLALSESTDLNNTTIAGTVSTWTDIVNDSEGYNGIDASGDGADEFYYSDWEFGSRSVNDFYERAKYLARDGSAETLYGLNGELFRGITHEIVIDGGSGTWAGPEALSWSGGTGQLLAVNDTDATSATKMWIQLLTGSVPSDGDTITGGSSSAANDMNVTITERTISSLSFAGASTGSAIIGAYGLGIGADDLVASDTVFDLNNSAINPPNNVTFTVSGLVIGEDRVLVGPESAGVIEESQLGLNATLSTDNITSIVMDTAIPTDSPSSGTIRVLDDSGFFRLLDYSSFTGSTFTISTTNGQEDFASINATAGNNVFISYIDKLATSTSEVFTVVYSSDRALFIRVRDGAGSPIKTFETTGTIGSAGGSTTVIRTGDV
jgi:hypothetical protein